VKGKMRERRKWFSFAAYVGRHGDYARRHFDVEATHMENLLEPYRNSRSLWEVLLEIIHDAPQPGVKYDMLTRRALKAFPEGFSKQEMKSSLSLLRKRKLIAYHRQTQTYSVARGAKLPLR